jgi:PilZ domain
MSYGDRKSERVRFDHRYPVNLMGVDGTWRRACVMLDVSGTGARLEVEGSLDVLRAQEFFLVLSTTGLAFRRCELVRIDGNEIGVRFVVPDKRKKSRLAPA